jgi:two-component system cell cycle response regulator DivK
MSEKTYQQTILYIEDNFHNRLLVKRVLEAEGYRVMEAEDAPAGITLAKTSNPDLILMDINLPDMDGYEATALIRDIGTLRNVPIVALTANVMRGDREKSLAAGCAGYIQKPIDVDSLPAQLAAFLER